MSIQTGAEKGGDLTSIGVIDRRVRLPLYPTGTRPKGEGMGVSFILSADADFG